MIEALESRIAPATLLSPTTATYKDLDGDLVTVKLSKPLLTSGNFGSVFVFSASNLVDNTTPQSLVTLSLYQLGAQGALDVTVSVKPAAAGDGRADIGSLDARHGGVGIDLGTVKVPGDIGTLTAGNGDTATLAIASLNADSLGVTSYGSVSAVLGGIGMLTTRGDLQTDLTVTGSIAKLVIGGSLRPAQNLAAGQFYFTGGSITMTGDLGSAKIRGSIIGTFDSGDGFLFVGGRLGSLSVGESITGPDAAVANPNSGGVSVGTGGIGSVFIGGSLVGGKSVGSGSIVSAGDIGPVKILGSMIGGSGRYSGSIEASGKIGKVSVGGDVRGGTDFNTGDIEGAGGVGNVSIGGSLVGNGSYSGRIVAANAGANIGKVAIKGSIICNGGLDAGLIFTSGNITGVNIGGDIITLDSGSTMRIYAGGAIGPVSIGGDLDTSSILAGMNLENPRQYGDGNDAFVGTNASIIASLTVKGAVYSEFYAAVEAHAISKLSIGGITYSHSNPALNFSTGLQFHSAGGVFVVREF